ncbi:MAG TPA: PIN domain-containing protein [Acidobacteriota bacterium]|nr:PIN domain-containing protein [Acidobacteriota bacterium]
MALILDTGPILALLDADDPAHASCAKLLDEIDEPLVLVAPALVEVDYWIRKRLQPEVWSIFVEDISTGAYRLEHLSAGDLARAAELQASHADLDLGMVDAAVIAVCERLAEKKVATLDQRHFRAVRPKHCDYLQLLPKS